MKPSAITFACDACDGVRMIRNPIAVNTASMAVVNSAPGLLECLEQLGADALVLVWILLLESP